MKWLQLQRIKREQQEWEHGFGWAATKLLVGHGSVMMVKSYIDSDNITPFDRGAIAACVKLIKLGIVRDDSI